MKRANPGFRRGAGSIALLFALIAGAKAQDLSAKFDAYMSALADQGRFTGAVLVARDGRVVFSRGYGKANVELGVPNTTQTKFRLGSITKQFTAAAILLLQEQGKLSVRDSICKYVDNCPVAWNEITIHHLLSHTGGVPNFTSFPDYLPNMMMPVTTADMIARFRDKPLEFKPGEKWSYSNSGYFLLGVIVEKVSGESYESFLQKNIFGPLGLAATGYDHFETILPNRATGYSMAKGKIINSSFLDMSQPYSAGSLYSTVDDLFRWNEALFGGKVLSAKSLEAMTTPVKNNYGYGLGVSAISGRKSVSHGGGINGFSTNLLRFPEEKVTIVVLRNADYGIPAPGKITQDLAAILFGEKYEIPAPLAEVKVDPKILDAYAGRYEMGPNFIITISKEGDGLTAQATNQPKLDLFAQSETVFFSKVVDMKITFVKDETGKVTHLIVHQNGDRQAKRMN
jgi:CubicO group peptidase (beta-lactamase class C family)